MTDTDETRVRLVVNGDTVHLGAPATVEQLLVQLGVGQRRVAVERNRKLVPKTDFDSTELSDGDVLELVTLVGGG